MNKPLFLFVGRSASGKTTVANMLAEKHGYNQVESYTTRKPRFDGETGHIFISEEEFKNIGELAAYTYYNNNHYGTTLEQLSESDIYVIDVPGVESLLQKLQYDKRPICIIYFDASITTRIHRMVDRGDGDHAIIKRLLQDEAYDWMSQLRSLVWKQINLEKKCVDMFCVDANKKQSDVLEQALYYIRRFNGDYYE